jgi:hypothetical protein
MRQIMSQTEIIAKSVFVCVTACVLCGPAGTLRNFIGMTGLASRKPDHRNFMTQ